MTDEAYSVGSYDQMFADRVRAPAYLKAIAQMVRPGDVVLEVGTGTGYFAVAAARAGARHVYAVERARTTGLAALVARENGVGDRITFIRGDAATVKLSERATVLICDLRGATPLYGDGIATIVSVRERLLTPEARIIPARDVMLAAPCDAPRAWRATELALGEAPHGISRRAIAQVVRSALDREKIELGDLQATPAPLATIDYATVRSPDIDADTEWTVTRDGVAHGFALWFDASLTDGIGFTTAPGAPQTVYGQGFLPWEQGIALAAGDRVRLQLRAKMSDGRYVLGWDTTITFASGTASVGMRQSTLGVLLGHEADLARRRATFIPDPGTYRALRTVLEVVDGRLSLGEIGEEAYRLLPGAFDSPHAAFAWVVGVLASAEDLTA